MKFESQVRRSIQELDDERLKIVESRSKLTPWLFAIPIVTLVTSFLVAQNPIASLIATVLSLVVAGITYSAKVGSPFKKLHQDLRGILLDHFMEEHHPDIRFSYYPNKQSAREIIRNSGLIHADFYKEEDVIIGSTDKSSFYLSEIKLQKETGTRKNRRKTTVFKGLLFRIKLKNKNFPDAQIESQHGFLSQIFSSFIENEKYGFWYDTNNPEAFDKQLEPLFPFIKYLIERQGDVRIRTFRDEIILMLESDMKFLDEPDPSLNDSFLNKEYYQNMGKQLNSLLFIIESFVNDLSTKEIEDRLELKAIEVIENKMKR